MEEDDRVSRASSMVIVSSTRDKADKKVQSFCKRSRSVQRDPNCAVVIRGWLYKRDSTGLKLWKRRWFVLSNFCLFYYKDSREDCVLGSLPLPSYKIFFCSPRECKNRKYAFKVVHQGMRSYWLSADTQEDMLGWVRALSQSACMDTDDLINRRCSSFNDFSQIEGSTESVIPMTQNKLSHHTAGSGNMVDNSGRHRATHSSDILTRSWSLDRTGEDHFLCQGSGPSTPKSHYGSRSHSPVGKVDLRPQVYSTHYTPVHKQESKCEKEMHTLTALQADTDMVLTCLCGCDKVLQTLSVELDLLQQDKEHAEFALDMSRIELGNGQLNKHHTSQKVLLQEELVNIRARMCDISQEMERVWLDYKRMESELCVFRSHLQHICHFGLPQERSLAQKHIWMMEDILSGLKTNRSRFKALMTLHKPTMFPLLQNSSLHPDESVHYWEEELEAPARPPLPLELDRTKDSTKPRPEWTGPTYTPVYNPATINKLSSTYTNTHTAESQSLCLGEECDQMVWRSDQKKLHKKRSRSPHYQMNIADQPHPLTESSTMCVMRVMRAELPSALTAQRVCVEELNPEQSDNDNVKVCGLNRESDLSEQRYTKVKRVERIRERALKSALRRSDSAHPLKFVNIRESGQRSADSLHTDRVYIHGNVWMTESDVPETLPPLSDIKPLSTNHISTLMINNMTFKETDQSVKCSSFTNQRAEWFLSTNHWQEFIPLNIQEEELLPTNQQLDTSTNQDSEMSTIQNHFRGSLNTPTSLVTLEQNTPQPSALLFNHPTGTSSDMILSSDHSERELCIYDQIQNKAPKSSTKDKGSVVGGANNQQSNISINHNADSYLSVNQHPLKVEGEESEATKEESAKVTGNDVMINAITRQPIYNCWNKNSVTSLTDSFLKPRVTVVSTSL